MPYDSSQILDLALFHYLFILDIVQNDGSFVAAISFHVSFLSKSREWLQKVTKHKPTQQILLYK